MFLDNETVLEQGNYRVKALIDTNPLLPEGDVYAPQFVVPMGSIQRNDLVVNIGIGTAQYLTRVLQYFDYNTVTFKRWAKIFHSLNADIIGTTGYDQGDRAFIIVLPDEYWTEAMGLDSDYVPTHKDVADLASYLWGDVITLELQELTEWTSSKGDTRVTYEYVDSIHGLYVNQGQGDEYVKDMARELLESNIT